MKERETGCGVKETRREREGCAAVKEREREKESENVIR